jgi:GH15 family glucan-1,4-alpha-glucosidase
VTPRIEDYGFLSDLQSAALVDRSGSIDWLCFPRFDSPACFAALLGGEGHGRWLLAPASDGGDVRRRYRPDSLVLETEHTNGEGTVRLLDFMPPRGRNPDVVRIVEGVSGRVEMRMQLVIRFDYGAIVPWVKKADDDSLIAIAGPDALCLRTPVATRGEGLTTVAEFAVEEGDRVPFVLTWFSSHHRLPRVVDPVRALDETVAYWRQWCSACRYDGEYKEPVLRSLMTLKGLQYLPSGGIVAAATTSLPEQLGGVRNWDHRYCWLRDATYTLHALIDAGYVDEAQAWRDWLLRAVAGDPAELQIMYGPAGERRLTEFELDWLPGYEGSRPVRIGNAASEQLQLDVYGEIVDTLYEGNLRGLPPDLHGLKVQLKLLDFLEDGWRQPDDGIWEVRGGRRHFTHSKVMAWVAFDRAIKAGERFGVEGPMMKRFRRARQQIHDDVIANGFDSGRGTFVQSYGSTELDASLLLIPVVGFLPGDDPRVVETVETIHRQLCTDGLVQRYSHEAGGVHDVDGLPPGEGAFLLCSFWLAEAFAAMGRIDEAGALFERILGLQTDLGLLSEEYDREHGRLLGNFPQAFSHVGVVNTALMLESAARGEHRRRGRDPHEA